MTAMTTATANIKNLYANNPWKGRLILTVLIIVIILTIIRVTLSPAIVYSTTSWLKKQGIESAIEEIKINLHDGSISLVNAKGFKDNDPLFNIGLIDIHWRWAPLSEKQVVVTKVVVDKIDVDIKQYTDEIIISGVHISLGQASSDEAKQTEDTKTRPWAISLGELVLTNFNVCYLQHTSAKANATKDNKFVDYCVQLEEMTWGGTISYATDAGLVASGDLPLSSSGSFALNGFNIIDNKINKKLLVSESNTLSNVVVSGLNKIHIDELVMNGLSALQREDSQHHDAVRFQQIAISDIKLTTLNSLSVKSIKVSKPGLYIVRQNQSDWEYQQWVPASGKANQKTDTDSNNTKKDSEALFKFTVDNINIDNSDMCYLEQDSSLYYCFVLDEFNWKGAVKFSTEPSGSGGPALSVSGDLKLLHPNVHNHTLKRNLLDVKSIAVANLNIADIENITLSKLNVKGLSALQRSENKSDNTLSFDELDIKDIKHSTNKIAINTIKLDGLADKVSKNKDGTWEHDKWSTANDGSVVSNETTKRQPSKAQQAPEKKPFVISLNKLNINSDKEIAFTDNSTEPGMTVGLQSLSFDISELHSDKPETDSPFKLHAKTREHSTIDIEGTIKPFAEKVSMDAKGKLKGLDLRVASPAVKKAIGHIIKTGQLDADLDLKAVEGKLNSNIALSLYHFQIKSVSKDDAKRLDEKFGMPLNQTLVLLRNKDDSIHLDIPITGDVNNPNFDPMDAIVKATSKAATFSLITFYTPYGLIYAGGNLALNLATALNFDPIEFASGSSELQTSGKEKLDGLSKLLIEKPQVHLTLCGITSKQDVLALYPEAKPEAKAKNENGSEKGKNRNAQLTKEQVLKLNQLASERQINSKNYLVNKHSIDHSRLILCEPEYKEDNEGVSGVEINI